jgi:hypothetical protein
MIKFNEYSDINKYRKRVYNLTKQYLRDDDIIVPDLLSIDHNFPVSLGFKLGIPPEVISDPRNVSFIPLIENIKKSDKCESIPLFIQQWMIGKISERKKINKGCKENNKRTPLPKNPKFKSVEDEESNKVSPIVKAVLKASLLKTEGSLKKIKEIIDNWDFDKHGKITHRSMFQNHFISKKTVGKYWKHFKEIIKEKNNSYLFK